MHDSMPVLREDSKCNALGSLISTADDKSMRLWTTTVWLGYWNYGIMRERWRKTPWPLWQYVRTCLYYNSGQWDLLVLICTAIDSGPTTSWASQYDPIDLSQANMTQIHSWLRQPWTWSLIWRWTCNLKFALHFRWTKSMSESDVAANVNLYSDEAPDNVSVKYIRPKLEPNLDEGGRAPQPADLNSPNCSLRASCRNVSTSATINQSWHSIHFSLYFYLP